jgi:ABC-2 type transport system ATP-binding protein
VAENLELFARLERTPDPRKTVLAMLEQTGLRERADERVGRLSGGNRQRVNIALGLLAEPPVLILDEPSSSLDPRQRERMWRFVLESSGRGRAVVFSTHNVAEAERYSHRVIVLADGELLFSGTPAELARSAGSDGGLGFEGAFVEFLRARGH